VSVEHRIDRGVLVLVFQGETSDAEIENLLDRLATAAAPPRPWHLLLDVRGSSSLSRRSPERIRALVEIMERRGEAYAWRLAVLVGEDVQFGLTRMASAFADPHQLDIRAFRDEQEARSWLTAPPGEETA
jgi:hypothetical protein